MSTILDDIYINHFKVTYRGIPTLKCPFDYVIYQMIVTSLKPDLIIEIGRYYGGSTLYLADLLDTINKGHIHSIDVSDTIHPQAHHPRITLFNDGYDKYSIDTTNYETVLVIEDSSHQYVDVANILTKYSPLVTKGSYIIVEDGIVSQLGRNDEFNGGPIRAIDEYLANNTDLEIDPYWCDFFGHNLTFNTRGYLKKIV